MPWSEWITPPPSAWNVPFAANRRHTTIDGGWAQHRETNPVGRPTMTFPAPDWAAPVTAAQALWQVGAEDSDQGGGESCSDDGANFGLTGITLTLQHRYFMGAAFFLVGPDTSTFTDTQVRLQRGTMWAKVDPSYPTARVSNPNDYLPPGTEWMDVQNQPGVDAVFLGWQGTITVTASAGTDIEGLPDGSLPWTTRVYVDAGQTSSCIDTTHINQTSPPDTGAAHYDTLYGTTNEITISADGVLAGVQEFTLAIQPLVPVSGLPTAPPSGITGIGNALDWSGDITVTTDLRPVLQMPPFRVFTEGMCADGDELPVTSSSLYGYDSMGGSTGSSTNWVTAPFTHVDGTTTVASSTGSPPFIDTPDDATSAVMSNVSSWSVLASFAGGIVADEIDVGVRLQIPDGGSIDTDIFLIDTTDLAGGTDASLWAWTVFAEGDVGTWVTLTFPGDVPTLAAVVEAGHLGVVVPPGLNCTWVGVNSNCPVETIPSGCSPPGQFSEWQPGVVLTQSGLRMVLHCDNGVTVASNGGATAATYEHHRTATTTSQTMWQFTAPGGALYLKDWHPAALDSLVEGVDYGVIPGKYHGELDAFVDYDAGPGTFAGWQFGDPVLTTTDVGVLSAWQAFYIYGPTFTEGTSVGSPPSPSDPTPSSVWANGGRGLPPAGTHLSAPDDTTATPSLLVGVEVQTDPLAQHVVIDAGTDPSFMVLTPPWRYWIPCEDTEVCTEPGWSDWQDPITYHLPVTHLGANAEEEPDTTALVWDSVDGSQAQSYFVGDFNFGARYEPGRTTHIGFQFSVDPLWPTLRDWVPAPLNQLTPGADYDVIPGKDPDVDDDAYVEYEPGDSVWSGWGDATAGDIRHAYMGVPSDPASVEAREATESDGTGSISWFPSSYPQTDEPVPIGPFPGAGTVWATWTSSDPANTIPPLPFIGNVESWSMVVTVVGNDPAVPVQAVVNSLPVPYQIVTMPRWRYWKPCPGTGGGGTPPDYTVAASPIPAFAVAGQGTATVTWSSPVSDGGTPITSYTVTYTVNGVAQPPVVITDALTFTVEGLSAGDVVVFSVVANNGVGASPPATSNAVVALSPPPVLPPPFPARVSGADSLECGTYHFYVMDRGGKARYFELTPVIRWRWNRVRDGISDANIFVSTDSPECCYYMGRMECGRHELAIERNGIQVWEGPITRLGFGQSVVEIEAHDVFHYPYKAIMKSPYNNAYPHIIAAVQRVKNILTTELARFEALTPPINFLPHLIVYTTTGTAKTSRSTKAFQRTCWEEIDEMAARGGIDYTVIGRKTLVFDVDDVIGRIRPLSEADFLDEVIVTQYGLELATYSAVTDGNGHWGAIGKTDPYYGIWEILETAFDQGDSATAASTPTVKEMSEQAKRNAFGRQPAPVVVRVPDGATLRDDTGLLLSQLVGGVRIPLTATQTCRKVSQEQKLDRLTCEGENGNETFRVTLSPAPGASIFSDDDKVDSG